MSELFRAIQQWYVDQTTLYRRHDIALLSSGICSIFSEEALDAMLARRQALDQTESMPWVCHLQAAVRSKQTEVQQMQGQRYCM